MKFIETVEIHTSPQLYYHNNLVEEDYFSKTVFYRYRTLNSFTPSIPRSSISWCHRFLINIIPGIDTVFFKQKQFIKFRFKYSSDTWYTQVSFVHQHYSSMLIKWNQIQCRSTLCSRIQLFISSFPESTTIIPQRGY